MDIAGRRLVAEEARLLLTSLRRGFPLPKLVEDLQSLRSQLLVRCPDNVARPFLNVVMDPRAAGPHTLAALRSIRRLLPILHTTTTDASELCKCILACKFEQTDSGVDEAVEMAIADVLAALDRPMDPAVHLDAFHTVFVTRQTFSHRPAIAHHLEEVLANLLRNQYNEGILEFLIQSTEEQLLALRLIRLFLETHDECSPLIPDDLCLNILLTGQAVLQSSDASLIAAEVCSVIAILWWKFRQNCRPAFAAIWSGFYTQLLVLLRNDTIDSSVSTVILESLVDILGHHDHDKDWGTLKTLFRDYDCHMHQSNVATHLILELAKCCGVEDSDDNLEQSHSTDTLELTLVEYSKPVSVMHKKLCAQALSVAMQCLFRDDHPTAATLALRSQRKRSILTENDNHVLRNLKAKKRSLAKAARVFNRKASHGFNYLIDSGLVLDNNLTPQSVAQFLRNGLVVGLDKRAVGVYLGEAGKQTPGSIWDGIDFHKECLEHYCSLFDFENQSVLDSLRMFLAAFRLPGEAQQIDRILQAFSDRCSQVCEECGAGIFSEDMKKASDAAYLLSFSIIMLNTDLHNANIREDRKMKLEDFIKNNSDYGKDISDKPLPREYLTEIYKSILQEEIRTEGEGAEGTMTVERWKDVLRHNQVDSVPPSSTDDDAQDMTELVVEYVWKPIVDAIGALWDQQHGNLLGMEGARLGMDMSVELLVGIRHLGRVDIFRKVFVALCEYTGLIGYYSSPAAKRTEKFCNSLESQAAVVVVIKTAIDAGEDLDEDCWRRVWSMILELRDLKLLSRKHMLKESDKDLLSQAARFDWNICLENGDMEYTSRSKKGRSGPSLFGAMGRAIFGSNDGIADQDDETEPTRHQKELLVVWDDGAQSDCEMDEEIENEVPPFSTGATLGAKFEDLLVSESAPPTAEEMPVTGLERIEDGKKFQRSMRYRVRERMRHSCDFHSLIAESRFMDDDSFRTLLQSLVSLVSFSYGDIDNIGFPSTEAAPNSMERASSDVSVSTGNSVVIPWSVPISPASEALIEVIICELALKNKDRLKAIWQDTLHDHYVGRLTSLLIGNDDKNKTRRNLVDPGLEKRVTGLLRLSSCAIQRPDVADAILSTWKLALPVTDAQVANSPLRVLDRHFAEGLSRVVLQAGVLMDLDSEGWEGLLSLVNWCGRRGGMLKAISFGAAAAIPEDDPAVQCYKAVYWLVHAEEVGPKVPFAITRSLRCLVAAGGNRNHIQLSLASLDLLGVLNERAVRHVEENNLPPDDSFWSDSWRLIVDGIAEAAELSCNTNIRQHALSMLTDLFIHNQGKTIPTEQLSKALSEVCVPMAGRRILRLQIRDPSVETADQLMMEFELCIGLIFKPLRHHLKAFDSISVPSVWKSVLVALEDLLGEKEIAIDEPCIPAKLKATMNSLANEHLQNAIQILLSSGFLDSKSDMTTFTWESVSRMGVSEDEVEQWKQKASTTADNSE